MVSAVDLLDEVYFFRRERRQPAEHEVDIVPVRWEGVGDSLEISDIVRGDGLSGLYSPMAI
jgi:hypothetical protein